MSNRNDERRQFPNTKRRFALIKLRPGDWLCPSNDTLTVWRFQRYADGRAHGLRDASYEERTFWRVLRLSTPAGGFIGRDEIDSFDWHEVECNFPSREAAINAAFPEVESDA